MMCLFVPMSTKMKNMFEHERNVYIMFAFGIPSLTCKTYITLHSIVFEILTAIIAPPPPPLKC